MSNTSEFYQDNYDAFISYRHESGFYMAQVIYDKLIYNGYSVFMDKRLQKGEFEQQIKEAVEKSRNFILILFPGDLDNCNADDDWLRKESEWAVTIPEMNFIPVFCEDFTTKSIKTQLPDSLKKILSSQGITVHRDIALDTDLDKLCDIALKNANPVKPLIDTVDFFENNLNNKTHLSVKEIDMAFHGGAAWLRTGRKKEILDSVLKRKIPTRILINTPKAAKSIAKHMHDDSAAYTSFEDAKKLWRNYAANHSDTLEVRVCPIPLLRVYHNIKFNEDEIRNAYDRMHIKYYVYQNMNLENSYEHELSSFSKYYKIYQTEFDFLWEQSTPIQDL